ncbi:MAG: NAD(P)H-dependent oxidoreductase [Chitinophagaceae bacterium]|nr:NAD(P)H-dependent oxidoreductase [Chitinophagaceae bacterium]
MAKILVLFAHPALEKSRVHKRMLRRIPQTENVLLNDLYETYPDLDIDIRAEQQLLLQHDIIIWQHPFYWYSAPAIIKQWIDLVLEHGWAYGTGGKALAGKLIFNAISSGGSFEAYSKNGRNRFTIKDFLLPFEQTAVLCNMNYLPPFVVPGTHRLSNDAIELYALQYEQLLVSLSHNRISPDEWAGVNYLNELVPIPQTIQS